MNDWKNDMKAGAKPSEAVYKGTYRAPDGSIKQYSEEMMAKAEACRQRIQKTAATPSPHVEQEPKQQQPSYSETVMPQPAAARKGYYKTPDGSMKQYSEDFMNKAEAARQRILNASEVKPPQQSLRQEEIEIIDLEQAVATELANPSGDIMRVIRSHVRATELGNGEAAFQLAQFYRVGNIGIKKDLNLAVDYYMKAAKLGYQKAFIPLEILCEEMNKQKQSALAHFYGSIFNHEKAALWHKKSTETEQFNLLM